MPVGLHQKAAGKVLEISWSGKPAKEDYHRFVPEIGRLIAQHGKPRLLIRLPAFDTWTAAALWEGLASGGQTFRDIERVAVVGEKRWKRLVTALSGPFNAAHIRYFPARNEDKARGWIAGGESLSA